MNVLRSIGELGNLRGPLALAIGVFDGMHPGHRAVLQAALDCGEPAVAVTFDPHPAKVLRPDRAPRLLTATGHKIRLMEGMGIRNVLVVPFDRTFADMEAEDFIRRLVSASGFLARICVGSGWRFGRERLGDGALLRRLGEDLGFVTNEVAPVLADGMPVSSTRIRQAVEAGDLSLAAQLLGRRYAILGAVQRGEGLGRQLGFPTANLAAHNEQFPPDGVYAVLARWNGVSLPAVANVGTRPTVALQGPRILEVHIPGFSGDLYGADLEVEFVRFLRPERKFASLEELKAQIAEDLSAAVPADGLGENASTDGGSGGGPEKGEESCASERQ